MNLAAEMAKLPEPPNNAKPPLWDYWRHDLWVRAQTDDPHNFMAWPCVYHTMLQDHWPEAVLKELPYVEAVTGGLSFQPDGIAQGRWPAIDEVNADQTVDRILSSHRNLIHQTYHILRFWEATGLSVADMQSIYEFGGGYGAMALVCRRLGFTGDYYICDLPEFALLQQWYLQECQVNNVVWVDKDSHNHVDLLIACYSLSETDFAERDRILHAWQAENYLFLYSNKFEQYDNIEYFRGLKHAGLPVDNWQHRRLDHLPPESWYTWGW